jgi:signal peptidase I
LDTLLRTRAKRSSSKTLIKRSAPDAYRLDDAKVFPNLVSDLLNIGHRVRFRAPGYSMYPTILHEDVITVEPVKVESIKVGDIVLYQSENSVIAHRVVKIENKGDIHTDSQSSALSPQSCFILRGDARPACDDPIYVEQILGKIVSVERNGRCIDPYSLKFKLIRYARRLLSRLKRLLN